MTPPAPPPAPRLAAPADLAGIDAVVRAAYTPYVARIGAEPGPLGDDYARHVDAGRAWVMDDAAGVAALLVLVPEAGIMLLDNVAVHPRAQGGGRGRCLLDFAEAEAGRRGYGAVRLYTHVLMTENQAIYIRRGYRETHRAREGGLDRVYMLKVLA